MIHAHLPGTGLLPSCTSILAIASVVLIISPSPVEKEAREQGRRFRWGHLNENYLTGVATQTLRFTAGVRGHFPLQELPLCSAGIVTLLHLSCE